MSKLIDWLKPLRPAASLQGTMVSLASFGVAYQRIDWIAFTASFECFVYLCATMVLNNYIDRFHDALRKKNDFAFKNQKAFFWYAVVCWLAEVGMLYVLYRIDWRLAALAIPRALLGFGYSWTRTVPLLPVITVAISSALCTVTPAVLSHANHEMWAFVLATILGISARETYKDIEDCRADSVDRWKRTIPVMWGNDVARTVARTCLVLSALVFLSLPLSALPVPSAWSGIFCISLMAGSAWLIRSRLEQAKAVLDGGMATFLLVLNGSYWALFYLEPIGKMMLSATSLVVAGGVLLQALCLDQRACLAALDRLVESGLDDGSERTIIQSQNPFIWPKMISLFWIVVGVCRLVYNSYHFSAPQFRSDLLEAGFTASILTVWLALLVYARVPHVKVPFRTHGYTIVERMIAAIVVGYFFAVFNQLGVPLVLVAVSIPLVAIIRPELLALRNFLKGHGSVLGIVTGVAIVGGIETALKGIGPAYLVVVFFYYYWYRRLRLPVYIPQVPIIGTWMGRHFTVEVP